MKRFRFKLLGLVILILLFSVPAFAVTRETAIGRQNSSGVYRAVVEDGVFIFAADTGIKFPYQSATTNDTLTAADSGRTYVITSGATSEVQLTLPAAAVGMEFPFISATTEVIRIHPDGSDIINYASLSAGDSIRNTSAAKGDSITLFCVTANEWSVKLTGTWADGN